MPSRDLVVIGGSAGAIVPLRTIVAGLAGFPGTVLVVIHVPPSVKSLLPDLLTRTGALPARHAVDGEPLAPGTILIAPPDRHLVVEDGCVRLTRDPRENGFRPAADALFRSAARAQGARVVGVVLSGALDDGTMGLAAIKAKGGLAVVQRPDDAHFPGMPRSAVDNVRVDAVRPASEIAPLLRAWAGGDPAPVIASPVSTAAESRRASGHASGHAGSDEEQLAQHDGLKGRTATALSCPGCQGVLLRAVDLALLHFQCQTGHAYSPAALDHEQNDRVDRTLGAAENALRERAVLMHMMASAEDARHDAGSATRLKLRARELEAQAQRLRELIETELTQTHEQEPRAGEPEGRGSG